MLDGGAVYACPAVRPLRHCIGGPRNEGRAHTMKVGWELPYQRRRSSHILYFRFRLDGNRHAQPEPLDHNTNMAAHTRHNPDITFLTKLQ